MKLSIIIPAKNEESVLPRALASIRAQKFTSYEIIVADAHSTDLTREIAMAANARVVDGGMPGPGRNRGAEAAKGEWLLFLDADIVLSDPLFLRATMAEIEKRKLEVATCRVHAQDGKMIDHALHGAFNVYALATEKILPHVTGACLFAKATVHRAIGGFDEDVVFAEDQDYGRRAKRQGFRYGILRARKIGISTRRLDKDGRMQLAAKYIYAELYMLTRGSFKHDTPFRYELAAYEEKETIPSD